VFFLNFMAEVPPLGVSTYFVRVVDSTTVPEAPRQHQAHFYDRGMVTFLSSLVHHAGSLAHDHSSSPI
jgi:hypothetical protein